MQKSATILALKMQVEFKALAKSQLINEVTEKGLILTTFHPTPFHLLHWLNYWHNLITNGTSGFRSNTLLIRIQYCISLNTLQI